MKGIINPGHQHIVVYPMMAGQSGVDKYVFEGVSKTCGFAPVQPVCKRLGEEIEVLNAELRTYAKTKGLGDDLQAVFCADVNGVTFAAQRPRALVECRGKTHEPCLPEEFL